MLGVWYDYNTCSTFVSSELVFNTTCQHGALLHCKQGNRSYWWKFLLCFLLSCRLFWFGWETPCGPLNTSFPGSSLMVQSNPWKCSRPGRVAWRGAAYVHAGIDVKVLVHYGFQRPFYFLLFSYSQSHGWGAVLQALWCVSIWAMEADLQRAPCRYSLDLPKVLTQELPRLFGIL